MARHTTRVWGAIINNMGDAEDIANIVVNLFIQFWNGHSRVDIAIGEILNPHARIGSLSLSKQDFSFPKKTMMRFS